MSSGATIRTRSSSVSGSSFCSGGGLMFGPRGISIEAASSAGTGARMCAWTTAGRAGGRAGMLRRGQLARVGDLARQHRRRRDRGRAEVHAVVGRPAPAREVPVERAQRVRARGRRLAHADARPAGRLEHPHARGQQVDVGARLRDLVEDLPRAGSRGRRDQLLGDPAAAEHGAADGQVLVRRVDRRADADLRERRARPARRPGRRCPGSTASRRAGRAPRGRSPRSRRSRPSRRRSPAP